MDPRFVIPRNDTRCQIEGCIDFVQFGTGEFFFFDMYRGTAGCVSFVIVFRKGVKYLAQYKNVLKPLRKVQPEFLGEYIEGIQGKIL